MYLKRLDVQGFKTFANRTHLEFGPGLTAVVGPNGSGKSNVTDALRWVLGEQSARTLRAKKTEDVIFAGSGKKSAMGMAEVSVSFDNSEGWLPVEFDEVVVSRRAFRSGDNEYLINGARVRLRDVLELFEKANVGQNSYAFMGQGMVDAVLSAKPEDRRSLLEEAADVRRHQQKLDDALNRLKQTRENTDKAQLLIAEIRPRLQQLERQARRADEAARLSKELAEALRELFGGQWGQAQEALTAAQAALDQRREAFNASRRELGVNRAGAEQRRAEIQRRRAEIMEREAEKGRLTAQLARLEQSITLDRERHSMLMNRHQELLAEAESLAAEREGMAGESVDAERQREFQVELQAARTALQETRQALDVVERRHSDLRNALMRTEENARRAAGSAQESRNRALRLKSERERLVNESVRLEEQRLAQGRSLSENAEAIRVNTEALASAEAELLAAEEMYGQEQAAAAEGQAGVEATRAALADLDRQKELLEARKQLLEEFSAEQGGAAAGVRAIFDAAEFSARTGGQYNPDVPTISGVIGVVSRLIRVPAGLELAIEAALAENVEAVVIQRQSDALSALRMLVAQKGGRAHVVAEDSLKHQYPVNLHKERGVVGVASSLVRFEGAHRAIVETLLGRTVVVQDQEAAEMILRRGLGNAVTMDGILFRQNGTLYGGAGEGAAPGFGRGEEIAELEAQIAEVSGERERTASRLERSLDGLEALSSAAARAEVHVQTLRNREREVRRALEDARGRLAPLRGEIRWTAEALQRMAAEIARLDAEVVRFEGEASEFERASEAATDSTAQAAELERVSAERAQAQDAVNTASGRVSEIQGELRTLEVLRERQAASVRRVTDLISAKRQQAQNTEREAAALSSRIAAAQADLGQLNERLAALAGADHPGAAELGRWQREEQELTAAVTRLQNTVFEAERALLEAESEVRRYSGELDSLRQVMEAEGYTVSDAGRIVALEEQFEAPPEWLQREDESVADVPPIAGAADADVAALQRRVNSIRNQIRNLGPVNNDAPLDYAENRERYDFLTTQVEDLSRAEEELRAAIAELRELIGVAFDTTFAKVNELFKEYFTGFFGGGEANLQLTDGDDLTAGVDIVARPPGKRVQNLSMLSGGERALTAISLLFALLSNNPSPICVLDEVDAALDEANVTRFAETLKNLSTRTQFIVVTHNRRTIEKADAIYGVSMADDSTSRILSLRLSDVPQRN